jgi:protein-S-isoprenylcysteine O-methyltransferase Ste14
MRPLLKTILFTVLVSCTVTIAIPYWLPSRFQPRVPCSFGPWFLIGVVLIPTGAGAYLWCPWEFATCGKGTPALWDPPVVFVATGLYRWVRNPMYLGIFLMLVGEALTVDSLEIAVSAFSLGVGFHLLVISIEESLWQARFGRLYAEDRNTVPRWLPRRRKSEAGTAQ